MSSFDDVYRRLGITGVVRQLWETKNGLPEGMVAVDGKEEERRAINETQRDRNEHIRQEREAQRCEAEKQRIKQALLMSDKNHDELAALEELRRKVLAGEVVIEWDKTCEAIRINNEKERQKQEEMRQCAEKRREIKETLRHKCEEERHARELQRIEAERQRQCAEAKRRCEFNHMMQKVTVIDDALAKAEDAVNKAEQAIEKAETASEIVEKLVEERMSIYTIHVETEDCGVLMIGDEIHYKFVLWRGWQMPVDPEQHPIEWKIQRVCRSFENPEDDPWNNTEKARNFDGEITLVWSADPLVNDLDPDEENKTTKFVVTATVDRDGLKETAVLEMEMG